jgi:hypothetical protein
MRAVPRLPNLQWFGGETKTPFRLLAHILGRLHGNSGIRFICFIYADPVDSALTWVNLSV